MVEASNIKYSTETTNPDKELTTCLPNVCVCVYFILFIFYTLHNEHIVCSLSQRWLLLTYLIFLSAAIDINCFIDSIIM